MQDDYDLNQAIWFFFEKVRIWSFGGGFYGKGIAPERQAQIFTRFYCEPEVHDKPGVGITIFLASRKPAKMEAAVSPIEALGYRPSHNASKIRKAGEGNLLTRLFGEQFTKDKKRTFMVLLSLAASLSVYLCVVTMLDSQAARTIVSNFMDSDLTGWNGSIVERIRE